MENNNVAVDCKNAAHPHVFNADFAMIAITVATVYTYLMVFTIQLLA